MAYSGPSGLRDNFTDNSVGAAWNATASGSATVAETSGQARFTLPSSTAGTHTARYTSAQTYDLTSDSFYITIETMVSTGVAATAFFQLYLTNINAIQWVQVSGTVYARSAVNGASTDRYSASWSGTTYKYLRIRADTTTVYWDSSTNGTSWTNRASLAISSLFPITDLYIDFGATCGNVATPGSFRLDDVNLILPALTTNWRWTQALEALTERIMPITLALDTAGTAQAYVVTADGVDVNGDPSGNVRYWSGPASQGRVLTEQTTQVAAEALALNIPVDGRFDLPSLIECKCIRLYHRSIDGNAYTLREFYPRRVIEADDIRAENISALHIVTGTITADKLSALMVISNTISTAYNGARVTLSGDAFGGLIGYGATDTYDTTAGTGTYQLLWSKADGALYAGTGHIKLDTHGISIDQAGSYADNSAVNFMNGATVQSKIWHFAGSPQSTLYLESDSPTSAGDGIVTMLASRLSGTTNTWTVQAAGTGTGTSGNKIFGIINGTERLTLNATGLTVTGDISTDGGLNIGSATGAGSGEIAATADDSGTTTVLPLITIGHNSSGTPAAGFGADLVINLNSSTTDDTNAALIRTEWTTATHASRQARLTLFAYDTAARNCLRIQASGSAAQIGFLGATPAARQTVTGSRGGNAALASVLTALATLGLITDSSSA